MRPPAHPAQPQDLRVGARQKDPQGERERDAAGARSPLRALACCGGLLSSGLMGRGHAYARVRVYACSRVRVWSPSSRPLGALPIASCLFWRCSTWACRDAQSRRPVRALHGICVARLARLGCRGSARICWHRAGGSSCAAARLLNTTFAATERLARAGRACGSARLTSGRGGSVL